MVGKERPTNIKSGSDAGGEVVDDGEVAGEVTLADNIEVEGEFDRVGEGVGEGVGGGVVAGDGDVEDDFEPRSDVGSPLDAGVADADRVDGVGEVIPQSEDVFIGTDEGEGEIAVAGKGKGEIAGAS